MPISLKSIEVSGAPSTGVGQTHSPSIMQGSSTNDQMEWKLRISKSDNVRFQKVTEKMMLFDDFTCPWSEFQRVGTATEKAWVPA